MVQTKRVVWGYLANSGQNWAQASRLSPLHPSVVLVTKGCEGTETLGEGPGPGTKKEEIQPFKALDP